MVRNAFRDSPRTGTGTCLRLSRDPRPAGEALAHENLISSSTSEASGTLGALEVARLRCDVGAAGADPDRPAAPLPLPGPGPLRPPPVPGRDPLRALHRHALAPGALPRARPPKRRDLPPPARGVVAARPLSAGDPRPAGAAGRGRAARLVAGDRRCLAGRGKKRGEKVARTLRGSAGSRFHLAVDAGGLPLAVCLGAGNENEQRYLLPLIDALAAARIHPLELWADRGYASQAHERALAERRIRSRISRRRKPSEPIPPGQPTYEVWRGKTRAPD